MAAAALVAMAVGPLTAESGSKNEESATVELRSPKTIVVKFHADWCGSCKAMGPVMTDLQNKFDGEPALFVTFDLTNQTTTNQAELHAAALGLGGLWNQNGGSTGKIYLVNAGNSEVVATLTSQQTAKEMGAALKSALE